MSEATVFLWVFTALCVIGAIGIWNNWGREKHNNRRKPRLNQRGFTFLLDLLIILALTALVIVMAYTIKGKVQDLANKYPIQMIEKGE